MLPVLRRLGRQDARRDDPGQGQLPHLHAARAARRRRGDRAVELPAAAGGVEGRAGARLRQHGHPEAREPDAADRAGARRDRRRGRPAARRAQRDHGPGRDASGRRSSSIPGIDKIAFTGDTATGKGIMRRRGRHAEEDHARARRQVAEHRFRRRRPRRGGPRRDDGHLLRQGRSVRRRLAAARGHDRSRTSSSTSSPRARRRWCPAIRWIRRRGSARSRRRSSWRRVLRYVETAKREGATLVAGGSRDRHRHRARATSSSRRCSPTSRPR